MEKIRHYYQANGSTCGQASLLIGYDALGITYNEVSLVIEMRATGDGTSWSEMFDHATSKVMLPTELKGNASYKDLQKDFKRGVVIVAWASDSGEQLDYHYSVVSGILKEMIELTDPGLPFEEWPTIMPKQEFLAKWGAYNIYPNSYLLIKPKKG